jgi:hypothetical protein
MDRKLRLALLIVVFVIIAFGIAYFSPYRADKISPISAPVENYPAFTINSSDSDVAQETIKSNEARLNISVPNIGEYQGIVTSSPETKEFSFQIGKRTVSIPEGGAQKIDVNDDGTYDLLISPEKISTGEIVFLVKTINEPVPFADTLNAGINAVLKQQAGIIFILLILLLIYVSYHLIANHFLPWFRIRKMKDREDPVNMFKGLVKDIQKTDADLGDYPKLTAKLKHFYEYMSKEDQKRVLKEIKEIERYIN